MVKESDFQAKILRYLRSKKCYVVKNQAGPGVPNGCPDCFFFTQGFFGALEFKKSRGSKLQPGQKETIEKFNEWSYGRICYPENWPEVKEELDSLLKEY